MLKNNLFKFLIKQSAGVKSFINPIKKQFALLEENEDPWDKIKQHKTTKETKIKMEEWEKQQRGKYFT
jgi:hypothetical protein